jgi:hypothetical protein
MSRYRYFVMLTAPVAIAYAVAVAHTNRPSEPSSFFTIGAGMLIAFSGYAVVTTLSLERRIKRGGSFKTPRYRKESRSPSAPVGSGLAVRTCRARPSPLGLWVALIYLGLRALRIGILLSRRLGLALPRVDWTGRLTSRCTCRPRASTRSAHFYFSRFVVVCSRGRK